MPIAVLIALIVLGVASFALCAILLVLCLLSPGRAEPLWGPDGEPLPHGVSEIVRMPIGGVEQGMILRGEDAGNPVLLYLHGGPGSPEYMMERARPSGLSRLFTVCWWDQRGSGMSYRPDVPPSSMTLDRLVEDTAEVARYLIERFGRRRIYLCGHSWGSYLGMHAIARHPELFCGYIGTGQISAQVESERRAHEYMINMARITGDLRLAHRLERFSIDGPEDLTLRYLGLRTEGMNKMGIGLLHRMDSVFNDTIMPLLHMPEYRLRDKLNYARGSLFSFKHLWGAVVSDDLRISLPRVEVPVLFIQGAFDYQVSHDLAYDYWNRLEAPRKAFVTLESSAHSPCFEEPELFVQACRELLLQEETA